MKWTVRRVVAGREAEKNEGNCKAEKRRKQNSIQEIEEIREDNEEDCEEGCGRERRKRTRGTVRERREGNKKII